MERETVWNTYMEIGSTAAQSGNYEIAETMFRAAIKESPRVNDQHLPLATVLENLAFVCSKQSRYPKAERLYKRAIALHDAKLTPYNQHSCRITLRLVELYLKQDRDQLAERTYRRAVIMLRRAGCMGDGQLIQRVLEIAGAWNSKGQHNMAVEVYKQVMEMRRQSMAK